MKNFKLKKEEELKKIQKDIEVEANENQFILTLFLTTRRLVLLKDVNKELDFNAFLASRMVSIPENLEVVFDLDIKDIKEIKYKNNANRITFKANDDKLILYCEDLTKLIKVGV